MDPRPIFVFAASQRSGSTLVQRLITASGEVLVWGEPGDALDDLGRAIASYRDQLGPPEDRREGGDKGGAQYTRFRTARDERPHLWLANMNPPEETIVDGFRSLLDSIYGAPARALGYSRWGVKSVRSGVETARFLRDAFPRAKFVFLVRHPFDSLRSIKRHEWDRPAGPDPLALHARRWARLASGFRGFEGGHLLRYEDLVRDAGVVGDLARYLELRLPEDFVGTSRVDGWHATRQSDLTWIERLRIRRFAGRAMREWRYDRAGGDTR